MLLWAGRKAIWKGIHVVILERVSREYVKVAYERNEMIIRIVRVCDVKRRPRRGWA